MNRLTQKLNASGNMVEAKATLSGSVRILRASDPGGPAIARQRRIEVLAYTGGPLRVSGWPLPVVVDLKGMDTRSGVKLPILINHTDDPEHTLGQMDQVMVMPPDRMMASGVVTGTSATARTVIANNDAGHQYQASIGIRVQDGEVLKEGQTATVNGRAFSGPVIIARRSLLGEISFVNVGADDQTSARIAARAAKGTPMTFELWLKARGKSIDGLAQNEVDALRGEFDAFVAANGLAAGAAAGAADSGAGSGTQGAQGALNAGSGEDPAEAMRRKAAAEANRISGINKLAAMAEYRSAAEATDASGQSLTARAIAENMPVSEFELQVLRASRPRVAAAIVSGNTVDAHVLQAAALRAGGYDSAAIEKAFKPQTLEVVDKRFRRGIGMKQLMLEAAWANGFQDRWMDAGNLDGVLRAAFSTTAISGILSNVANKFLVRGFMSVNQAWRRISMIRPATDFKTMTSYRLTADAVFEKVGPAGQIKHGTLGEESWTNQIGTYGRMVTITRQDQINDDLGAITQVPQRLGLGAGRSFNQIFWTVFLDNAAFFAAANGNYISGSTTTLTSVGLGLGVKAFRDMVDTDGHPVDIEPSILAVPSALEVSGRELYQSGNVNTGGAASTEKVPNKNIYTGLYEPLTVPYLGNSAYTGYSTTAWYLLCDPNVAGIGVMEVAFLNGQENPTIETADADFSTLGIQMRGFSDFGAAKAEKKAGIKSKGAA